MIVCILLLGHMLILKNILPMEVFLAKLSGEIMRPNNSIGVWQIYFALNSLWVAIYGSSNKNFTKELPFSNIFN